MTYTLCVLGCGTMGVAILSSLLKSKDLDQRAGDRPSASPDSLPGRFITCVSRPESVDKLNNLWKSMGREDVKVRMSQNVCSVAEADVVLLCCKPQVFKAIFQEPGMHEALSGKLVISILAGVTISQLQSILPDDARVVRAMPNTPCQIQEGMIVLTSLQPTCPHTPSTRALLLSLFSPTGRCCFLEEKHFDACTAVSGSGPAFSLVILEAIADGGVMMGLPREEALQLAAQTMQGAARMVLQTGLHPASLKDRVTTPAGCTIAGLLALEDGKIRSTTARAIQTATLHAAGLGSISCESNTK